MKHLTFILSVLLLVSCNSVKRNQKFLASGNYDQAIQLAVKKIVNDRNDQQVGAHIVLLEEAFAKAVANDNRRIRYLQNDNSPEAIRELYTLYIRMENRQGLIRPLLPLQNPRTNNNANFRIVNYTPQLVAAKNRFAQSLYDEAIELMRRNNTLAYRDAHAVLQELKQVQSNYKDVDRLLEDAHFYGTDFVLVHLTNRSDVIIPRRLEQELLDFNAYNLDDFWTAYHSQRQDGVRYDFGITLNFRDIAVSPERISEREFKRKKRVKDGWEYKTDRAGNKMKDENGDFIKIDVFKDVTARVMHTVQTKSVLVGGDVMYRDLNGGRNLDKEPLATEFVFEHTFAKYRGDERALTKEDKRLLENDFIPFPNNAQMVLDAGDEIKGRLAEILKNSSFR